MYWVYRYIDCIQNVSHVYTQCIYTVIWYLFVTWEWIGGVLYLQKCKQRSIRFSSGPPGQTDSYIQTDTDRQKCKQTGTKEDRHTDLGSDRTFEACCLIYKTSKLSTWQNNYSLTTVYTCALVPKALTAKWGIEVSSDWTTPTSFEEFHKEPTR